MEYRIADKSDCKDLTNLRMEMRKELEVDFCEEILFEKTFDFFSRNIENKSHIALVCEDNKTIIGTVGLTLFEMLPTMNNPNGKVARLMNMYVIPQYRRKGIARKMLELAIAYAKENSCNKIILNPSKIGKQLYLDYGFQMLNDEYVFNIK